MSFKEIREAVIGFKLKDELATAPGFCRRSTEMVTSLARKVDKTEPRAEEITAVVWPRPSEEENVHYAARAASAKEGSLTINIVPALGFPEYIGPTEIAPGLLPKMVRTDIVA